ncbi:hypothetical protein [Streptomyces sp. NPDC086023]|uniref:hypothetical protein n=1 Tax=Streptomyces sp. NPDC086023 TaxID=3365746 RepID=UPI0037D490B9
MNKLSQAGLTGVVVMAVGMAAVGTASADGDNNGSGIVAIHAPGNGNTIVNGDHHPQYLSGTGHSAVAGTNNTLATSATQAPNPALTYPYCITVQNTSPNAVVSLGNSYAFYNGNGGALPQEILPGGIVTNLCVNSGGGNLNYGGGGLSVYGGTVPVTEVNGNANLVNGNFLQVSP